MFAILAIGVEEDDIIVFVEGEHDGSTIESSVEEVYALTQLVLHVPGGEGVVLVDGGSLNGSLGGVDEVVGLVALGILDGVGGNGGAADGHGVDIGLEDGMEGLGLNDAVGAGVVGHVVVGPLHEVVVIVGNGGEDDGGAEGVGTQTINMTVLGFGGDLVGGDAEVGGEGQGLEGLNVDGVLGAILVTVLVEPFDELEASAGSGGEGGGGSIVVHIIIIRAVAGHGTHAGLIFVGGDTLNLELAITVDDGDGGVGSDKDLKVVGVDGDGLDAFNACQVARIPTGSAHVGGGGGGQDNAVAPMDGLDCGSSGTHVDTFLGDEVVEADGVLGSGTDKEGIVLSGGIGAGEAGVVVGLSIATNITVEIAVGTSHADAVVTFSGTFRQGDVEAERGRIVIGSNAGIDNLAVFKGEVLVPVNPDDSTIGVARTPGNAHGEGHAAQDGGADLAGIVAIERSGLGMVVVVDGHECAEGHIDQTVSIARGRIGHAIAVGEGDGSGVGEVVVAAVGNDGNLVSLIHFKAGEGVGRGDARGDEGLAVVDIVDGGSIVVLAADPSNGGRGEVNRGGCNRFHRPAGRHLVEDDVVNIDGNRARAGRLVSADGHISVGGGSIGKLHGVERVGASGGRSLEDLQRGESSGVGGVAHGTHLNIGIAQTGSSQPESNHVLVHRVGGDVQLRQDSILSVGI